MDAEAVAIFIPIIFILFSGYLIYFYIQSRTKERMAIIEKSNSIDEVKLLFEPKKQSEPSIYRNVKWGILFISLGLAIVAGVFLEPYFSRGIIFGLVFLFPGIGLLVYYYIFKDPEQLKR